MSANCIDKYLEIANSYKNKLQIVLVCNVEELTTEDEDYAGDSITSEYLTLHQYNKILSALRYEGYEVISYFEENKFMQDVITGICGDTSKRKMLVLNSAQKGTKVGRKSLIPAFCDLHNIWYNNSNAHVVSLCRDKFNSGCILERLGLPTPKSWLYRFSEGWLLNMMPPTGAQVIAKLNYETSSIGLSEKNIFSYSSEKDELLEKMSQQYQQDIIVQQFIPGYEVETSFVRSLTEFVLTPMGIRYNNNDIMGNNILDYNARKNHPYTFYELDSIIPELVSPIQKCSLDVGNIFAITGLGRIDFRITSQHQFYITDVATNPGYGDYSSTYQIFHRLGYTYSEMLSTLVGISIGCYLR